MKFGITQRLKRAKNAIFASIHRPSLNQGSIFSLWKCQIQISHIFLHLRKVISRKIFSHGWPTPPHCVVAPNFRNLCTSAPPKIWGGLTALLSAVRTPQIFGGSELHKFPKEFMHLGPPKFLIYANFGGAKLHWSVQLGPLKFLGGGRSAQVPGKVPQRNFLDGNYAQLRVFHS